MSLIDSHCHLNYDHLPKTGDDLVREAQAAGVEAMVTIGTDLTSIEEIQKISEKYDCVYHTIGVHPHDSSTLTEAGMIAIEKAAHHPKCRAIGEIGLDYHYDHSPRDTQKTWLKRQLDLALQLRQPVVIHSRDGEEDLFALLSDYSRQVSADIIPGIIHCFSGTQEFGAKCIDLGFYISFSGILTFKKADEIRIAAQAFPLDKLLVETDSPFLAPIPFRGKKCEPSMVKITAQKLAEIKGLSFDEVAAVTTRNARRIFRITD